ncbi:putative membrane protein [Geomicrobium sediminis]|uniref:Membrane protein n=1 Tax=Geomicrobium sediminis TaxID=1347788 RepID=A0ABS2PGS8_9BACL|nr:putative membrane protein [Geomicrobium sediminis]
MGETENRLLLIAVKILTYVTVPMIIINTFINGGIIYLSILWTCTFLAVSYIVIFAFRNYTFLRAFAVCVFASLSISSLSLFFLL